DLRALRTPGKRPRVLRCPELPPHLVLPRPRSRGANAVRRSARADRRSTHAGSIAIRPRPRAQAMKVPTKPDPRAATPPIAREEVDVRSLQHELRRSTEAEIRFTPGDRAL